MKRLNIYIISSARNLLAVQLLGDRLRRSGHEILDWTAYAPPLPVSLGVEERKKALDSDERGLIFDFCSAACASADLAIYIGKSGQDSACEVGMAYAAGVPVIGFAASDEAPGTIMGRAICRWVTSAKELLTAVGEFSLAFSNAAGACRVCGCTDDHACLDERGIPCHWVEPDLCSVCAGRE